MTTATPATTPKKDNRLRCESCSKKYAPKRSTQKFCSTDCRIAGNSDKRPRKPRPPYTIPRSAPFCKYIIREIRRAGTVQVLALHTDESLIALYKLNAYCSKVNMYRPVRKDDHRDSFQLSHIIPVCGARQLGLLHPENLVVSRASQNQQHGTKHFGHGKGIPQTDVLSKWSVTRAMSNDAVFDLILKLVGKVKFEKFAKAVKLKPSVRHEHIEYLKSVLREDAPEHAEHLKALRNKDTKTAALGAIVCEMKGKKVSTFKPDHDCYSTFRVFKEESKRLAQYRPLLMGLHDQLLHIELIQRERLREEPVLHKWEVAALFNILHGQEMSVFAELLADMTSLHTRWNEELALKYKPWASTQRNPLFDVVEESEQVVHILKTFSCFADELDEQASVVVPKWSGTVATTVIRSADIPDFAF